MVELPVPLLHHWMLTVCQDRLSYLGLCCLGKIEAVWTASFMSACTIFDSSFPCVLMLTLPRHNLVTAEHVVMCSALVLVTQLGSNGRGFG